MTCLLCTTGKHAPITVQSYKQLVARRQQFRELVAKRAQKTSALNPIIFLKVSRLPEALCICTTTKFDSVSTKNDYGYQTNMLSLSDCLHHPEALYKEMFKHLQRDDYYSTAKAIRATAELRNLLSDRSSLNSMMVQLGSPDARTMDPLRYKMLLEHLADMFFPGVLWFDFEFMPPEMKHAYGDALLQSNKEGYLYSRIRLNPTAVEYPLGRVPDNLAEVFHHRAVFRIATLLHEEQVNYFTGHGWAWQRIAAQVEFMAQLKLGLPLDLGRFCSIQNNWHDQTTWPSVDEVEQWDLHDALTWPCEADMVELRKLKP